MESIRAFAMGATNRGNEMRVFDWVEAATLIAARQPREASAGLGGDIWADGKPVPREDTYTYLASTWAHPQLDIDGEIIDCYRMESAVPGWGAGTYWPPEALAIVTGEVVEGEIVTLAIEGPPS